MTASRRGEPCDHGSVPHTVGHCDYYHAELTVLPDRLYDVTAEWLWREYGHVYERDWNRDAWRLLVMVRAVIDEGDTPPAALTE